MIYYVNYAEISFVVSRVVILVLKKFDAKNLDTIVDENRIQAQVNLSQSLEMTQ